MIWIPSLCERFGLVEGSSETVEVMGFEAGTAEVRRMGL